MDASAGLDANSHLDLIQLIVHLGVKAASSCDAPVFATTFVFWWTFIQSHFDACSAEGAHVWKGLFKQKFHCFRTRPNIWRRMRHHYSRKALSYSQIVLVLVLLSGEIKQDAVLKLRRAVRGGSALPPGGRPEKTAYTAPYPASAGKEGNDGCSRRWRPSRDVYATVQHAVP
eukprot:6196906-Pleurochrysis_carterae.AAC.2